MTEVLTEIFPPVAATATAPPAGEAATALANPIEVEPAPAEIVTFTEATAPAGIAVAFKPARTHVNEPLPPAHASVFPEAVAPVVAFALIPFTADGS
jgi:hypothetical protein